MPRGSSQCIVVSFAEVKAAILKDDTRMATQQAVEMLEKQCGGKPIVICGETKQRALSKYQQFMAECMKGGQPLRECVQRWKEAKNSGR